MHLQAGALLKNGEYKIEKVLGQGGFGITYLAEQTSLGRKVALKEFFMEGLCNRDADTSNVSVGSVGSKKLVERFKQKFIKEARMIASFDNSHIISIHDVFEENGTAYYVMEYLGGKSLSAIVNEQGIMSETLAMKYIRQVADALAEVHANNLLHLDVKPANIMLNKKGEAVLIDFGISKHYDEAGNQTSSALIGTSEGYAPIEQYEAGALDSFTPATDIYALGATLFFLLTGTRPPKASEVMNYGLPELPSGVSASVRSTIETAMQPAIAKRPQSIAEFLCLVESGKMQDESDGETELNGNEKAASKREGENLFTHTASESSFDEVKVENGKLVADEFHSIDVVEVPDSADGNVIMSVSEESHSASPVISNVGEKSHSADAVISNESEKSNSAGIEILPPYSRQNDKDGNEEVERKNEKEHSAGAVISNESEKSQKNKPGKSLWLILLLLLVAVAGAWFLFGGTGSGDAPKRDTKKKQIVKKDTPTPPVGEEQEQLAEKGDSILDVNDHSDTSDGTKIEDDKEDGDRNISADQITDGNKVSGSKAPTGSETDIKGSGSTVASNNNEEVNKVSDICFNVTDEVNKTVEVAKGKYTGSIVIPKTVVHNDVVYSVTSIGKYAFSSCTGLTSITIPNGVTSIGVGAFNACSGLTSIIVDKNNPKYDSRDNCNAIIETKTNELIAGCKNTVIPGNVTSIGEGAFRGCSGLTSITIPNSVTSIGVIAFEYCSGLTSITIPNSVTSIGEGAFFSCSGLTSIIVDKNNPKYDSRDNCNAIIETKTNELIAGCKNTVIPGNVTSIGDWAFLSCSGLTSVTIPNSVKSIGTCAFDDCSGLTSITIGNSVTSIGNCAFDDCSGLTSIKIPNSVTSIGRSAFSGCSGLTSIIVDKKNPKYDSRNNCNAIIETRTNELIVGCKNTVIPGNVTSIGKSAFWGCSGLTSITIPNSVTSIGVIAFEYCSGLTSITIPNSVTSIGEGAFSRCSGLTSIIVDKNNPKYDSRNNCNAIIETRTNELIVGCKNTVIPGNVTSIGSAFFGCSGLTSITIPNSVTSIGTSAFYGCSGLTSVTIPNSVTSIGMSAFYGCTGLTSITI